MSFQDALIQGAREVRLARCEAEVRAAQELRYRVFYEENGAKADASALKRRMDADHFDAYCDHLLALDSRKGEGARAVVGTYRLMRRENAGNAGRFYTSDEFDISALIGMDGEILELGRSCVDAGHRDTATMQLLWRGVAAYVFHYDIRMMFGCASLRGVDIETIKLPLSYLHHFHMAPEGLRPRALERHYNSMNLMAKEEIKRTRAIASLSPLIKGYLRLGGVVGDGAVIDRQFNTTDVCVMVKTDLVAEKYARHYDRTAR